MTIEQADIDTRKGATFLDVHRPGWEKVVNEATLDTRDAFKCVLGQTGGFMEGIHLWAMKISPFDFHNGFQNPYIEETFFHLLDAAWKRRIAERRA